MTRARPKARPAPKQSAVMPETGESARSALVLVQLSRYLRRGLAVKSELVGPLVSCVPVSPEEPRPWWRREVANSRTEV